MAFNFFGSGNRWRDMFDYGHLYPDLYRFYIDDLEGSCVSEIFEGGDFYDGDGINSVYHTE